MFAAAIKSKTPYEFLSAVGAAARFCPFTDQDPKTSFFDHPAQVKEYYRVCCHIYTCMSLYRNSAPLPQQLYDAFVGLESMTLAERFVEEYISVNHHPHVVEVAFAFACRANWKRTTHTNYVRNPNPITEWIYNREMFAIKGWRHQDAAYKTLRLLLVYQTLLVNGFTIVTTNSHHVTIMAASADLNLNGKELYLHFAHWAIKRDASLHDFLMDGEMTKRRSFLRALLRIMIHPDEPGFKRVILKRIHAMEAKGDDGEEDEFLMPIFRDAKKAATKKKKSKRERAAGAGADAAAPLGPFPSGKKRGRPPKKQKQQQPVVEGVTYFDPAAE